MRAAENPLSQSFNTLLVLALAVAFAAPARAQDKTGAALKPAVVDRPSTGQKPETTAAAAAPAVKMAKPQPAPAAASKAAISKSAAAKDAKPGASKSKSAQSIVVLVGDDPITGYEIEQRQRLLAQGSGLTEQAKSRFQALLKSEATQARLKDIQKEVIEANQGKTRDQVVALIKARMQQYAMTLQKQAVDGARAGVVAGVKQKALDQIIDERLMMQEAKRQGVLASDDEVERYMNDRASRGKMTKEQYAAQFKNIGIDLDTMRSLYRAQMSWQEAVRRKYGHQIQISERDIDQIVAKKPGDGEDDVELLLQRVTLPMPVKMDQKTSARRFQEAEALWGKFAGCSTLSGLATGIADAKYENLGAKKPSTVPEPTRGLLLSAKDGDMLPPSLGQAGVELWAVCGRNVVKADEKQRTEAAGDLRQQQFGLLADRYLKDLRKDTPIEYR